MRTCTMFFIRKFHAAIQLYLALLLWMTLMLIPEYYAAYDSSPTIMMRSDDGPISEQSRRAILACTPQLCLNNIMWNNSVIHRHNVIGSSYQSWLRRTNNPHFADSWNFEPQKKQKGKTEKVSSSDERQQKKGEKTSVTRLSHTPGQLVSWNSRCLWWFVFFGV